MEAEGLRSAEAAARLARDGANVLGGHRARVLPVAACQLRSPLLILLLLAAAISFAVGERVDAVIIAVIVALSVGLGVFNEYRAERAADLLHDRVRRQATVLRDGGPLRVDVAGPVVGDVVLLRLGDIVPADVTLIRSDGLSCDESILTGEAMPVAKSPDASAYMGTVVHSGTGRGVVVATGPRTRRCSALDGSSNPWLPRPWSSS